MIKEMKKIQMIGPRGELDECIKVLHAIAVVHIETVPQPVGPEEAMFRRLPLEKEKLREKHQLENARENFTTMLGLLTEPSSYERVPVSTLEITDLVAELKPIVEEVKTLHEEEDTLTEELSLVSKYERLLKGFAPIVSRLGGLNNFEIDGLTLDKTREDITGLIQEEIDRITGGTYEMHVTDLDADTIGIVLTYPRKFASDVRQLITGKSISEIKLPGEYQEMPLLSALTAMGRRKQELPGLITDAAEKLQELSGRWYGTIKGLLKAIDDAMDEIGVLAYAGQTKFTFVIEGWAPVDSLPILKAKFRDIFNDKILIRELEIREEDVGLVPVCIKNPRIFKPFEVFLRALPPPRYGSVDPTPYVALFFPTFFGLIVGDIGYGGVITIASRLLKRRFRASEFYSDILSVFTVCGLSAMVFGFLFGELFGDLGERLGILHPLLLHRIEALETFLVLTIGIGVGHVVLGLIIGAANRIYRGRRKEAGVKIAYLILVAAFLFIIAVMYEYLPKGFITPGVAALIIGFAVLVVIEGALGPLEFIKTLGNILSYVRIMAIGTASVVMALVANKMGGVSENLIVGIIAATVIHLFNIFLSVLSPVIQSMRLQYVEFFSKFFEGGGRRYEPFKKR